MCAAAKRAVVGLMRTMANELAPDMIRVDDVQTTTVAT
jgi:NAD(P)-dependent dehydrogenase (short-subunit alcohol dehydrogenase family)